MTFPEIVVCSTRLSVFPPPRPNQVIDTPASPTARELFRKMFPEIVVFESRVFFAPKPKISTPNGPHVGHHVV